MGRGRRRASTVAAALVVLVLVLVAAAACAGDDDSADPPSATVGTAAPSTTSTTLSVEEEVEAAYLRSWEVFAEAALTLDTSDLANVYAGPALEVVTNEIAELRAANTPARYEVEHDYSIEVDAGTRLAQVVDNYINHSVLLDPDTHEPIEPDPNEELTETYLLQEIEGTWKVVDFSRD